MPGGLIVLFWLGYLVFQIPALRRWRDWLFGRGKLAGHSPPGAWSFKGRAGRREWAVGMAWNGAIGGVVSAAPVVGPLLSLPWTIAVLAVTARRLHDIKHSGWTQLIAIALFGICLACFDAAHELNAGRASTGDPKDDYRTFGVALLVLAVSFTVVLLAFYAWLGFTRGAHGPNVYGEADSAEQ